MHDDAVRDELIILAVAPGERACGRSQVSGKAKTAANNLVSRGSAT